MRGVFTDLTGRVFCWLTVLSYAGSDKYRNSRWLCRCQCGKELVVFGIALKNGNSKSCGCFNRKQTSERRLEHGQSAAHRTKEYSAWISAKGRCYNPNDRKYQRYGARGIIMCDLWRESFLEFFNHMGKCPPGYLLDRINNDGNYEPGNCRWTTPKISANNRKQRGPAAKQKTPQEDES